jgi:hypothetical protein
VLRVWLAVMLPPIPEDALASMRDELDSHLKEGQALLLEGAWLDGYAQALRDVMYLRG